MEEQKIQEKYMKEAIRQAKKAGEAGDVPIGCVIVYEGKIIARGYNKRNQQKSALGHAEISAIRKASKKLGDWRLEECTMYVTLEPCPMCAGAIVQARIPEVVCGSHESESGMRRKYYQSASDAAAQSSGPAANRDSGGGLPEAAQGFL